MQYFWLLDEAVNKQFDFQHHPGEENLADYPSKAHNVPHHRLVQPIYLQRKNSPWYLLRA